MSDGQRVCRTCLRGDNLAPIFTRVELHERYTLALFLTTGLQIEMDDGLPQSICTECINLINTAIEFRNHSHKSERKLFLWGYKRRTKQPYNTVKRSTIETRVKRSNFESELLKEEHLSPQYDETFSEDSFRGKTENQESLQKQEESYWNGEDIELHHEDLSSIVKVEPECVSRPAKIKIDKNKRYEMLIDGPMGRPGPYECKACKKILKNWSSFRTHAKIHLGFDFMCEYCGKKFIAVTMLQRHCMSQHGTERTYRCQLCDHRALDSERLKIHVRREHTGDRPYVCDACGASFLIRRNLVHHLAVHMTQRTVQCPQCPAKFKSAQHLACHTSKVHRRRGWRAQCYLCENSYTKYENVRKHLARVHSVPRQHQEPIRRVRAPLKA